MKAWRIYDINDMRLDEMPVPEIKSGWILVKVRVVQPSVTEVQWSRGISVTGADVAKILREKAPLQMFGHEFCGTVIEISDGITHVKVGDRVIYGKYSGTEVELEGETYVILRESDILAIEE